MINHFRYSKGLHVLVIICFLLPFFYTSCDDSTTAKESDSVRSENSSSKKENELSSTEISKQAPILKPFLNPSDNVYSGIATVFDSIPLICFFMTPIAFLILLIGFTTKFIDKNARRIIVLLDFLVITFLLVAQSLSWECQRLWGFWTTVGFVGLLTIYDIYINILFQRQQKGNG